MTTARLRRLLPLVLLLGSVFGNAAADAIQTYNLTQRQASELIPIIQPMLPPGTALSGQGYTLLVRGNPDAQAMVEALLQKLDGALHNLKISVRFTAPAQTFRDSSGADVRVRSGDAQTTIGANAGKTPRDSSATVRLHGEDVDIRAGTRQQYQTASEDSDYTLRVLEGNTAFIQTGTDIPYGTQTLYPGGVVQNSVELRAVRSGFYVRPRLHGNEVLLDILPQQEKESASGGGRIDTQHVDTTTSARLGEWVELGGVSTASRQQSGSTLYSTTDVRNRNSTIYVKVEIIP